MLFRLPYSVINFFLSMNEEIHDSSNILFCISSQNDTAYYISLENNTRRFTALEGKSCVALSLRRDLGTVTPTQNFSPPLCLLLILCAPRAGKASLGVHFPKSAS